MGLSFSSTRSQGERQYPADLNRRHHLGSQLISRNLQGVCRRASVVARVALAPHHSFRAVRPVSLPSSAAGCQAVLRWAASPSNHSCLLLPTRHSSYGRLLDDHDYGSWGNYNNPLYDDS